jgi:tRNA G18 (ribose-2'-O)-methylase SpoU
MLHTEKIVSLDRVELQPYRTLRWDFEHRRQGIFVAEGEKVVRRLLHSRLTVVSLLLPEKWAKIYEPLLTQRPETPRVFIAEKKLLERLTGFSMYQGIHAIGRIPPPRSVGELLASAPRPWLLAAVDGLSNAENVGGLVRNCAAFGVQALIVGETSSSPWLRRAVRSSMGTVFDLPVIEAGNLAVALRGLRQRGVRCVAAHPRDQLARLSQARLADDCCLVFGSEAAGISEPVLAACDEAVAIPMPTTVDSLNVGSAAAVFLYEAARQRGRA